MPGPRHPLEEEAYKRGYRDGVRDSAQDDEDDANAEDEEDEEEEEEDDDEAGPPAHPDEQDLFGTPRRRTSGVASRRSRTAWGVSTSATAHRFERATRTSQGNPAGDIQVPT